MAAAETDAVLVNKEDIDESNAAGNNDASDVVIVHSKYDSTETVVITPQHKTSMNGGQRTPLISIDKSRDSFLADRSAQMSVDLDNRTHRLSRWILCYFIFVIAEMCFHAIFNEQPAADINGLNKTPYRIWLASDVFFFLACILTWFSLHYIHELGNASVVEKYDEYVKYAAGGLFVFAAFLQWIAVIEQNHYNYCTAFNDFDQGAKSYCQSYVFAVHWMGHFFALFIGIDIMDVELFNVLSNKRKIRMMVYCLNLFFMAIIMASDIDYFYKKENAVFVFDHYRVNVVEAGYFVLSLVCLFIAASLILSVLFSMFIMEHVAVRAVCSLLVLMSAGMILFGCTIVIYGEPYNQILSLVPMVMIVYDLQYVH